MMFFTHSALGAGNAVQTEAPPPPALEKPVPIVMYHKISVSQRSLGKHVIAPEELEADLRYLTENGYETVFMADLIAFVHEGRPLPDKPIVLTFDDGFFSDYLYVFPLLNKYDCKAVFSIIGRVTDEYSEEGREDVRYPHMTWKQIREMVSSGHAEFQNHSYDLHKGGMGAKKRKGESAEQYGKRLSADLGRLQARLSEMVGVPATTFTYPYGAISEESGPVLREMGFRASLSCSDKVSLLRENDKRSLFVLGRANRPHGRDSAEFFGRLEARAGYSDGKKNIDAG